MQIRPETIIVLPMEPMSLHELYSELGAHFTSVNGGEAVLDFGQPDAEYRALNEYAGLMDLTFRGRLCLTGADRTRFLNGQVTNNLKTLNPGQGCYAALVSAKGKLQSDLNVYCLQDEILLDFEPGISASIQERLEKYVIADEVQIVDVSSLYGLLSVQGPLAGKVVEALGWKVEIPRQPLTFAVSNEPDLGDIYLANQPRLGSVGFDFYVPSQALAVVSKHLTGATEKAGGRQCGWQAWELTRKEAGIPRYGTDMDETNLAPEAGLESRAISHNKGCYIGQEVLARIRTYGQVAKSLRRWQLSDRGHSLPAPGEKLLQNGTEVGYITSAFHSTSLKADFAFGYVRKEVKEAGAVLNLEHGGQIRMLGLPFESFVTGAV